MPQDRLQRLAALRDEPARLVVGLMSGMSADGIDVALVRILSDRSQPGVQADLVAHATFGYEAEVRARIRAATAGTTRDVCMLSFELAGIWADAVGTVLAAHGVPAGAVDLIGSHGQTLDHVPPGRGTTPSTLQVGDGDVLAHRTGIPVVSDFRCRDMAAGGEGAPLVPFADWLLYARPGEVVACQNLGSIANVTVVTERLEEVRAFDTGPANAVIDGFARRATGRGDAIDEDGVLSGGGRVDEGVLASLYEACRDFLEREPPKSASYDDFGPVLAERVAAGHPHVSGEDLVRTAVEFTAATLVRAYERWVLPGHPALRRVLLTGGGAHNPSVVSRLRELLEPHGVGVDVPDSGWIDAKEAVAFALLADATVRGIPSNVPGATGASERVLLGRISL